MAIDTTARHLHHRVPRAVLEFVTPLYFLALLLLFLSFPLLMPSSRSLHQKFPLPPTSAHSINTLRHRSDLDQSRNPGHITKDRLEAVALENAFLHAKLDAVATYRDLLGDALADEWTELECLRSKPANSMVNGELAGRAGGSDVKMEVEP